VAITQLSKGAVSAGRLDIDGFGRFGGVVQGSANVDPASIAAGAKGTATISVSGLLATDTVVLEPPAALEAGLVYIGHQVTAGTITINLYNPTAGPIDGTSRSWTYKVLRTTP
jgi:hypothetical protein